MVTKVEKSFTNDELEKLLIDALKERNLQEKGKKFENFFEGVMAREKEFEIIDKHSRSHQGEVDYIYRHNIKDDPFWKISNYICIECKNWKEKITAVEINHFISLLKEKSILACMGIFITTSSYEKSALESIRNAKNERLLIIPLEKKHLKRLIEKGFKEVVRKEGEKIVFKM